MRTRALLGRASSICSALRQGSSRELLQEPRVQKGTHDQAIDRRAASLVLALGGVAVAASPAQALTGVPCDDGDA
jgi:hypothetical protein